MLTVDDKGSAINSKDIGPKSSMISLDGIVDNCVLQQSNQPVLLLVAGQIT